MLGVLIDYIAPAGSQCLSPPYDATAERHGLIVIVRNGQTSTSEKIIQLSDEKSAGKAHA